MNIKEPDKLAQDVHSAIAARMSYGMWKAMQRPVEPAEPKVYGTECVCEYCGESFFVYTKRKRKYCCDVCSYEASKERERKRTLERRSGNG